MRLEQRNHLIETLLGKRVDIVIDRPVGYVHVSKGYSITYPVNYGYIPGICGGDGEDVDVYLLGITEPVTNYSAKIIGAIRRLDDREDKLVSQMRNTDGFISVISSLNENEEKRNLFKTDILINGVYRKEADEEKNIEEHAVIKGAIFNNYTKALLPVSFTVYNPNAITYFESHEPSTSKPVFTQVWGPIVSKEFVNKVETTSAFGAPLIEERKSTKKEYVITGALGTVYDWDTEETILASELKKAMGDREIHLAEIKKRAEEYKAGATPVAPAAAQPTAVATGDFKF